MIAILGTLIVLGLVYWLVTLIPLPEPFPRIIQVIVIIIVVIYLLQALFGVSLFHLGSGGTSL